MKSFKQFYEEIFIGHKLNLQELQKFVKGWSNRIKIVIKKLKENSDNGQYGYFCKEYPEYVATYWNAGGCKLQPSKKECEDFIKKTWNINKPINSLSQDEKEDLLYYGIYKGY